MKTLISSLALIIAIYISDAVLAQNFNSNQVTVSLENEDGTVNLKWETQREINSRYFLIEKSTDGVNFSKIATVNASSNSMFPRSYSFTDAQVSDSSLTYTYRVILVTMDGLPVVSSSIAYRQNIANNIAQK